MCDCNISCYREPPPKEFRGLSVLMLDCWQREYDKRPYRNFRFDRLHFEERFERKYYPTRDFPYIVYFMQWRRLSSVKLVGFRVFTMLDGFVEALTNLKRIELKLMDLPLLFFQLFRDNVHNIHVEELILEGTPLTKDDVQCLRSILIKSKLLRYINVGNCRITQYNFAELADGIHKSESIVGYNCNRILGKNLSLDSEKIAYTVSSMIWQNKLQEIEMQQCEFVAQDMEIIAEYMSYKCSYLRKLNVANNKIGPDGALYLLKAIVSSGTLTHLDLNGCGLGNHGGELIAKYISSCYTLQYLNICFNNINSAAINCILLTMKKPIKLHKLQMYGNKYNPKTGNILRRLLGAGVLLQDNIDLTVTFDDTIPGYRVIPWRS
ncbi:uncharacterized protein LOC119642281 [Glossina fuscipes]|uniref:Uncharacterized protein LOC119642281 n=1 Tax=Glossina fuscipes TaxID=7396 RepID=A0A9C5ZB53_9MUSC|nr:uncharacterized protein LOC119642281 [Glossina fuscipes]